MRSRIESLIGEYREQGVLVDSNLLLLYLVGTYNPRQIGRLKRTNTFTEEDFLLLHRLLGHFDSVITTPPILTEVSNFVGQFPEGHIRSCTRILRQLISQLEEKHRDASTVSKHDYFLQFRLTDTGIADIAANDYVVVTDDLPLYHALANDQAAVVNFNHLRTLHW